MRKFCRGALPLFFVALAVVLASAGLPPPSHGPDPKIFEVAVAFSQSLSSWALLIAGGSIVVLVGTSYYRPEHFWVRSMYLAFLPGWFFLAACMYSGTKVQSAYIGFLNSRPEGAELRTFLGAVNDDAFRQVDALRHAMYCFGVWLVFYLIWWLFSKGSSIAARHP
jgi:hypothetical protein